MVPGVGVPRQAHGDTCRARIIRQGDRGTAFALRAARAAYARPYEHAHVRARAVAGRGKCSLQPFSSQVQSSALAESMRHAVIAVIGLTALTPPSFGFHLAQMPRARVSRQATMSTAGELDDVKVPMRAQLIVEPTPFTHVSGYANRFKEYLRYQKKAGAEVSVITPDDSPIEYTRKKK